MARQTVYEDVVDSIQQLSLALSSTNDNLKDANDVLSNVQHTHVEQNNNIKELRDDLSRCMEKLNLKLKNKTGKCVSTEPPLATSTPVTVTTRDSGIPTENRSTHNTYSQINKSTPPACFDDWLRSVQNRSFETPLMPNSEPTSLSTNGSISIEPNEQWLNDRWKRKAAKTIQRWREKCQDLEETLKIERSNMREGERKNSELKNRCFQLEFMLETERRHSYIAMENQTKVELKMSEEQKQFRLRIEELNKTVASFEKLESIQKSLDEERNNSKLLLEQGKHEQKLKELNEQINQLQMENKMLKDLLLYLDKEVNLISGVLAFHSSIAFQTFLMPFEPSKMNEKFVAANTKCKLKWILDEVHKLMHQQFKSEKISAQN